MIYTVVVSREDGEDEMLDFGSDSWSACRYLVNVANQGHDVTMRATTEPIAPSKFRESQQGTLDL